MTNTTISAAAISRILKTAGIKKAPTTDTWGVGFIVTGYGIEVGVTYQDTDRERNGQVLNQIVELVNGRADLKYKAERRDREYGGRYVRITRRTEEEIREIRLEQAAEESPYGVTKREVVQALYLGGGMYGYSKWDSGFYVERVDNPAMSRLVRVLYRDHPHTAYAKETGGREAYRANRIESYAHKLRKAGYSVHTDGSCVLVGQPGEFEEAPAPQTDMDRLRAFAQGA